MGHYHNLFVKHLKRRFNYLPLIIRSKNQVCYGRTKHFE